MAPVGEESLAMRADVPVEGEHADKRREFLWISDPESLGDLGFLVVPKCREHFRNLPEGHGVHSDPQRHVLICPAVVGEVFVAGILVGDMVKHVQQLWENSLRALRRRVAAGVQILALGLAICNAELLGQRRPDLRLDLEQRIEHYLPKLDVELVKR